MCAWKNVVHRRFFLQYFQLNINSFASINCLLAENCIIQLNERVCETTIGTKKSKLGIRLPFYAPHYGKSTERSEIQKCKKQQQQPNSKWWPRITNIMILIVCAGAQRIFSNTWSARTRIRFAHIRVCYAMESSSRKQSLHWLSEIDFWCAFVFCNWF